MQHSGMNKNLSNVGSKYSKNGKEDQKFKKVVEKKVHKNFNHRHKPNKP